MDRNNQALVDLALICGLICGADRISPTEEQWARLRKMADKTALVLHRGAAFVVTVEPHNEPR